MDELLASSDASPLCRVWLHMLYAAAAISVDFSRAFFGEGSQRSPIAWTHLQAEVADALDGATLYDLAQPAVRQLLAQHKCLLLSLQQPLNANSASFDRPALMHHQSVAGTFLLPQLTWEDGLQDVSTLLQSLQRVSIDSPDTPASASSFQRLLEAHSGELYNALLYSLDVLQLDSIGRFHWWCQFVDTDPSAVQLSSLPSLPVKYLLNELGMPLQAMRAQAISLNRRQEECLLNTLLPTFSQQLLAYLRHQFSLPHLMCLHRRSHSLSAHCKVQTPDQGRHRHFQCNFKHSLPRTMHVIWVATHLQNEGV